MTDLSLQQAVELLDDFIPLVDATTENRTTRSRLRAFFTRRRSDKLSKGNYGEAPFPTQLPSPPTTPEVASYPVPTQTSRPRGNTSTSRPSANPLQHTSRQRALTTWDPPPLFQAYSHTILQSILEVPTLERHVSSARVFHRRGSSDITNANSGKQSSSQDNTFAEQRPTHRRNVSSGISNTAEKLFVLVGTGYILQYSLDGTPDRLPEKILELGSNSIAFATDVMPGKPYVLRVMHDGSDADAKVQAPRSTWSRLTFRHSEVKRLVKNFLLIFDDPRSLDVWLCAVRKEVEALGGVEYGVDTPEYERMQDAILENPDQAQLGPSQLLRLSRSSPILSMAAFDDDQADTVNNYSRDQAPFLVPSSHPLMPRKSFGSSVETKVGLESLKGSSYSDKESYFPSTRTSVEGSAASASPASESFPSSVTGKTKASRPPRLNLQSKKSSSTDPALFRNFAFPSPSPRTPSVPSPLSMGSSAKDSESPLPAVPQLHNAHTERPLSIIAPLPEIGLTKKTSQYRNRISAMSSELARSPLGTPRPPSSRTSHSRQSTLGSDGESARTSASYSLFPKRFSSLEHKNAAMATLPSPPLTSPERAMDCYFSPMNPILPPELEGFPVPAKPVGKYHQRKPSNMSITTTFQFPAAPSGESERTPAVTSAHIKSGFGTKRLSTETRSVSAPQVPSSAPLTETKPKTPTSAARHTVQKSLPNLPLTAIAPGPPPSGPLPALPKVRVRSKTGPRKRISPKGSASASTRTSPKTSSNSSPSIRQSPRLPPPRGHARGKSSITSVTSGGGIRKSPPRPLIITRPATSAGEKTNNNSISFSHNVEVPCLPMPAKVSPLMGLNFSLPSPSYSSFKLQPKQPPTATSTTSKDGLLTPNTCVFPPSFLPPRDSSIRYSQPRPGQTRHSNSHTYTHTSRLSKSSNPSSPKIGTISVSPPSLRRHQPRRSSIASMESGVLGMHHQSIHHQITKSNSSVKSGGAVSDRPKTANASAAAAAASLKGRGKYSHARNLTGIELALLAADH